MKLLILTAAVALGVMLSIPGASSSVHGKITLVGTTREHHFEDSSEKFPGRETFYWSLASVRAKGLPFGYGVMACAFTSAVNTLRQCQGTFSLPRGRIMFAGSFLYSVLFRLAITGGTEAYSGAAGTVLVQEFVNRKQTFWFTVSIN